MRTWFWYKSNGEIAGEERYVPNGWDLSVDLNDPDTSHRTAKRIRDLRTADPEFGGFVPYDCPCDGESCSCGCAIAATHYVVDGVLVQKPGFTIEVDGEVVPGGEKPVDKSPGTTSLLQLRGALPDGAVIIVQELANALISVLPTPEVALTFSNGATDQLEVIAPPRGILARLALKPVDGRHSQVRPLRIRGW